ncbi:hypothetical protein RA27_22635 [Ruegeria sp. ANG-R]|uniref:diacylglycerol kinase n=1 Tax=Ruegeria sp. ANG-R TaxID=1577903 RepID=UPI00057E1970|nr:diacylglycerol kinase [Ruegeria sp. ANG-R]KIC35699.1 hypothetical protein RA27_22635 [Ruegeria sp. ANG-R]
MNADNEQQARPPRISGFSHVFAAFGYSMGGLKRLRAETAFNHELIMFVFAVFILVCVGASLNYLLCATALFLLLLAAEALNTAIECIVDHVSPGYSIVARDAKDLGSFAVFCLLVVNTGFFVFALWKTLL